MLRILILAAMTALLALAVACGDDDDENVDDSTRTGSADASPADNVCGVNPDPADATTNVVDSPAPGDEITSPVEVTGQIAAFEATFRIALYGATGAEIVDVQGTSIEGQTLAPYSESVEFTVTEETPACLWVYEASAMDGRSINVVQVPVVLLP